MKLFKAIEKEEFNVRDRADRRKRVNRVTVSYIGIDGEYRKSFVNCRNQDGTWNIPEQII